MSEILRQLLDGVREARPVDKSYLFFAGYLTPNGELHFGHIGGPFLRSDVAARYLRVLGADVCAMTASDCFESSVAYASVTSGTAPGVIADTYTRSAATALAGLDIEQTVFINGSTPAYAQRFSDLCRSLGHTLARAGRLSVRTERLFATGAARPEYAIAAFLGGTCPFCGGLESGNVCERCGMWLPAESMDRPWLPPAQHPESASPAAERQPVRSVFATASPDLAAAEPQGRVEPAYAYLTRDYVKHYGPVVRMTLPLPWGVPWDVPLDVPSDVPDLAAGSGPTPGSVHSSYITGKYASTRLIGQEYAERFGVDPFARDSTVTTVAIGGLDSAMGWLSMLALTGPELDFRPFDHIVVNRYMLLHGSKFSTSRRHVIRVNDALDRGLSPDAIRLSLARTSPSTQESDFVPEDVAKRSRDDSTLLAGALRPGADPTGPALTVGDQRAFLDAAADCLLRQREAFVPPRINLPAAAEALARWAQILRHGQPAGDPLVGREVLAVLGYPLIPRWATAVWRSTGQHGVPGTSATSAAADGLPLTAAIPALPPITAEELSALVEHGRQA